MISCRHLNRLPLLRPYFLLNFAANTSAHKPAAVQVPLYRPGSRRGEARMGLPAAGFRSKRPGN
jgi:hypothetical protein